MNEYENEPVRGLPEVLPAGEEMIWQGAPRWQCLARRAFHVRKIALYFAVLIAVQVGSAGNLANEPLAALQGASWLVLLGAFTLGLLTLLAWLYARTTVYTLTDKRLVMRFGVALPMMINVPWSKVDAIDLRQYKDGTGDIIIGLSAGVKSSYWVLWPHARPWHFSPAQPMLRSLPQAQTVADALSSAIRDTAPAMDEPSHPLDTASQGHGPALS